MSTPTPTTPNSPSTSTSRSSRPVHPLALRQEDRTDNYCGGIHILYGGTESEVLRESIDLSRDLLRHGQEGAEVLYINTLISGRAFEPHVRRAAKNIPQNRRFHSITLLQQSLAQKLAFLKKTIEELNIRYLVLNGFEFATLTSRHRIEIFFWLKEMRDEFATSIIIFTQSGPRKYGTLGQMRFVSKSCEEVGAYLREADEMQFEEPAADLSEAPVIEAEEASLPDHTPGLSSEFTSEFASFDRVSLFFSDDDDDEVRETETLKTKELELENVAC